MKMSSDIALVKGAAKHHQSLVAAAKHDASGGCGTDGDCGGCGDGGGCGTTKTASPMDTPAPPPT
jgi:hypothetical protein